ncbi:hypothetical protein KM043_007638 [Ampulex compressa]|nr:hypothetical protein KM043_007638 [Ampulex compressa]
MSSFSGAPHYEKKSDFEYTTVESLQVPRADSSTIRGYDSVVEQGYEAEAFGDWYPAEGVPKHRQDTVRRFKCPKCGNGYKYLGDMKKHLRFQCGQEPNFECPYCHKRAKVSSNMYAHVRSVHADQPIYIIDLNKRSTF